MWILRRRRHPANEERAGDDGVLERLGNLETEVERLHATLETRTRAALGQLGRVEQNLQALIRLSTIPLEELPYPQKLTSRRFRLRSQNAGTV